MENAITIQPVQESPDFLAAKELILEYTRWLGIDLAFQNFDQEINSLPSTYGLPHGRLFIAVRNGQAVGVAGVKRFDDTHCELKRMFVQPGSRGLGIGQGLLAACIKAAGELSYETIKLDTADFMRSAIQLYTANGFVEIPAYRHNPHEAARYFELTLRKN